MNVKYFRTEKGEKVNLVTHTKKVLASNPDVRIYIGCDSQTFGGSTKYVTVVCYRWEGLKGAHYVFKKEEDPRYNDVYTKLYQEGVKTLEVLGILEEIPFLKIEAVEFDFNDELKTLSTPLVSVFKGWCEGLGQRAVFKSGEMLATKAADHLVKTATNEET